MHSSSMVGYARCFEEFGFSYLGKNILCFPPSNVHDSLSAANL